MDDRPDKPRSHAVALLVRATPFLILLGLLSAYRCLLAILGIWMSPQLILADAATIVGASAFLTPLWYPIYRLIVYRLNISVHRSGEVRQLDMIDFLQAAGCGTFLATLLIPLGQTLRNA
jgi:hypothetical protein